MAEPEFRMDLETRTKDEADQIVSNLIKKEYNTAKKGAAASIIGASVLSYTIIEIISRSPSTDVPEYLTIAGIVSAVITVIGALKIKDGLRGADYHSRNYNLNPEDYTKNYFW